MININDEQKSLFYAMTKLGFIRRTSTGFAANPGYGFPRLLLNIPDEEKDLMELTMIRNSEHYKILDSLFLRKLPRCKLRNYLHTINNIQVQDIKDKQHKKILYEQTLGSVNKPNTVIAYGNNKQTLFAAAKRQIKMAPTPDPAVLRDFIHYAESKIEEEIGFDLTHFSYDYAQWFNHLTFAKQQLIKQIQDYYTGELDTTKLTKKQLHDILDMTYTAICKTELQPPDGKPRMVCSIPQKIKYAMGPITWKLEEICQEKLKGYCGGKNLDQMADDINKLIEQGFTKVVEGDGSAFDNTQDVMLKEIDRYIYRRVADKVYHIPQKDFLNISQMLYKKMKIKYIQEKHLKTYLTYYVLGTVFSGDCDTTLCNTIRMAMYNRYVNEKAGLKYGKDFVVFSKGDDFSVLYKPYVDNKFIDKIYDTYFLNKPEGEFADRDSRVKGIGQILKFLEKGNANSFKFCSLRSWYINNEETKITLTRDPQKLFSEALYSIKYKSYNNPQRAAYHLDLAMSYISNYYGIDIFNLMAIAHYKEFLKYKQNTQANEKLITHSLTNMITKTYKLGLSRQHVTNETVFGAWISFYDITPNKHFYKIKDSYWETIKHIMMKRSDSTPEELKIINQQINAEFNINYLEYLLDTKYNEITPSRLRRLLIEALHNMSC